MGPIEGVVRIGEPLIYSVTFPLVRPFITSVFDEKKIASDPTVYVAVPTRTDASQTPDGYKREYTIRGNPDSF